MWLLFQVSASAFIFSVYYFLITWPTARPWAERGSCSAWFVLVLLVTRHRPPFGLVVVRTLNHTTCNVYLPCLFWGFVASVVLHCCFACESYRINCSFLWIVAFLLFSAIMVRDVCQVIICVANTIKELYISTLNCFICSACRWRNWWRHRNEPICEDRWF